MASPEGRLSVTDRPVGGHERPPTSGKVTVWYQTYLARVTKLLVPTVVVLISISLPACWFDATRSTFSIVKLDISQESYKKALTLLGNLPEPGQRDVARRSSAVAGTFGVSPWGWCVEAGDEQSLCSEPSLFYSLEGVIDTIDDPSIHGDTLSPLLLRMLSLHVIGAFMNLAALASTCWYLWQLRQQPDRSNRAGWLQFGPVLSLAILATMAWITDEMLMKSATDNMPDETVQRGSGITFTAIAAGLAWGFFFVWAGPAIAQSVRSHWRQQRSYASYWQNGQWKDVENGIEEDADTKASEEKAAEKSIPKHAKRKKHWYSRKRESPRTKRQEGPELASNHRTRREHTRKRKEREKAGRKHRHRRPY